MAPLHWPDCTSNTPVQLIIWQPLMLNIVCGSEDNVQCSCKGNGVLCEFFGHFKMKREVKTAVAFRKVCFRFIWHHGPEILSKYIFKENVWLIPPRHNWILFKVYKPCENPTSLQLASKYVLWITCMKRLIYPVGNNDAEWWFPRDAHTYTCIDIMPWWMENWCC